MQSISGTTITLTRGETIAFKCNCPFPSLFATGDTVLFTVKSGNGDIMIQSVYTLDASLEFTVVWGNDVTDDWAPGSYSYDAWYIKDPVRNTAGKIVDGGVTRNSGSGTITITSSVGEV